MAKTAEEKAKSKARLAAKLKELDSGAKEADRVKRANLRTKVAKGDRKTRRKAASELSSMPRQFKN